MRPASSLHARLVVLTALVAGGATGATLRSASPGDGLAGPVQPIAAVTGFTDTYRGSLFDWGVCAASYPIKGYEPTTPGKHPVFIYTVGTFANYDGPEADTVMQEMAARGFVAISARYFNSTVNADCTTLRAKAACLYNPAQSDSALSKACGRPSADCSKGIVVGGMSQGIQIGMLAKNYDPRVEAAWGMGASTYSKTPLNACLDDGTKALPGDRLRLIDGEQDNFAPTQTQQEGMTGISCAPGSQSCFRPNWSGWYRVSNGQTQDGNADHCYYSVGGCIFSSGFDFGWLSPSYYEWSLARNLDWLKGFVTP